VFRAIVLGLVQGLTEFVPVSSTAHLVLMPFFLGWAVPSLAFTVAVHLGTALAVVAYFRRDLWALGASTIRAATGRGDERDRRTARLLGLLALATVPAVIAGVFLRGPFEDLFTTTEDVRRIGGLVVGITLLGTAAIILGAEWLASRRSSEGRPLEESNVGDAATIGVMQAVAILPGISRSGATISGGMARGLRREAAARFSFLLSLPAIIGAAILALPDLPRDEPLGPVIAAGAASAVTGFAAIAFLLRYLRTRTMRPFALYCLLLGAVAIGYWFQVK